MRWIRRKVRDCELEGAAIRAELFTIGGQKISTLVDAYRPAGR